ncbi:hypothetical protein B0H13DRAFT_2266936 [Mycena leptocephala]|nr:hypothetical protein B0H13DRAFT_2266936 [Mycena leptocephala]
MCNRSIAASVRGVPLRSLHNTRGAHWGGGERLLQRCQMRRVVWWSERESGGGAARIWQRGQAQKQRWGRRRERACSHRSGAVQDQRGALRRVLASCGGVLVGRGGRKNSGGIRIVPGPCEGGLHIGVAHRAAALTSAARGGARKRPCLPGVGGSESSHKADASTTGANTKPAGQRVRNQRGSVDKSNGGVVCLSGHIVQGLRVCIHIAWGRKSSGGRAGVFTSGRREASGSRRIHVHIARTFALGGAKAARARGRLHGWLRSEAGRSGGVVKAFGVGERHLFLSGLGRRKRVASGLCAGRARVRFGRNGRERRLQSRPSIHQRQWARVPAASDKYDVEMGRRRWWGAGDDAKRL